MPEIDPVPQPAGPETFEEPPIKTFPPEKRFPYGYNGFGGKCRVCGGWIQVGRMVNAATLAERAVMLEGCAHAQANEADVVAEAVDRVWERSWPTKYEPSPDDHHKRAAAARERLAARETHAFAGE